MRLAFAALALAGCAQQADVATATGALGSGSGMPVEDPPPPGSGSNGEDLPHDPPDPCRDWSPWTMCDAELNTWQKAPYVDSCWIGAPRLLPVHTTQQIIVTCWDNVPKRDGDHCTWDTKQWELGRNENVNHGTSVTEVCDHGPRQGDPVLIKARSIGMLTDVEGGARILGALGCTCDGFNNFMGADSLQPASTLVNQVIAALGNTDCDLTNLTPTELAAAVASMMRYGNYGPLWQCAGAAVTAIRNAYHACNNDAAVEEQAFWRGGECPAADQLPGLCQGPRWYF
jgi:hypothetical protein